MNSELKKFISVAVLLIFAVFGTAFGTVYYYEEVKLSGVQSENRELANELNSTERELSSTQAELEQVSENLSTTGEELNQLKEKNEELQEAYRFTYEACQNSPECSPPAEAPSEYE
jgi:peptidoglycan hydrolase CwlO-like protein